MGARDVGGDGDRPAVEGTDRGGIPGRRGPAVSRADPTVVCAEDMEAAAADRRDRAVFGYRGAVACPRDPAQSAVFRLHDAQRERVVPRIFLVLFHQRARAAISESAVSARLQHRTAAVLLVVPPVVVLS